MKRAIELNVCVFRGTSVLLVVFERRATSVGGVSRISWGGTVKRPYVENFQPPEIKLVSEQPFDHGDTPSYQNKVLYAPVSMPRNPQPRRLNRPSTYCRLPQSPSLQRVRQKVAPKASFRWRVAQVEALAPPETGGGVPLTVPSTFLTKPG